MADRRISRAAHPIINAWRCQIGTLIHQGEFIPSVVLVCTLSLCQDNDDDGETAAGGRLAHLLQILVRHIFNCYSVFTILIFHLLQEVNNILVIVTRYFGGIHLGPDRFKHINQAARNALELGGFLDATETKKNPGRGKRH